MLDEKKEKRFVSVGDASNIASLDPQTIRKLFDNEKIAGYKTPSGQRKIDRTSLQAMCNSMLCNETKQIDEKQNFLYTRVSTKKQMDNLSRQIEYIRRPEYSQYTLISDIGSGINFKRKGLSTILDSCLQGTIGEIIVTHKDRLCSFGFELIESIVTKAGGTIKVLDYNKDSISQSEFTDDLVSIIRNISYGQMGRGNSFFGERKEQEDYKDKTSSDS
jgi:predicted site-specific integrase-resolvase